MKVGLVSDIHGNLPALEAVLEDMPAVDDIVCAGDIVGYNPWPADQYLEVRYRPETGMPIKNQGEGEQLVTLSDQICGPLDD